MMTEVDNQIEVNVEDVTRVIITDVRIGNRFLDPYTDVGGLNLLRDLNVLRFIAHHYNLDDHARFIRYAIAANEERMTCHIRKMKTSMISFKGKTLAIFGIAFEEGTSDISYSPAVSMCKKLVKYGCNLRIYDPLVPEAIIRGVFPIVNRVTIMGKTLILVKELMPSVFSLGVLNSKFQQMDWGPARPLMAQGTQVFMFDFARNAFIDVVIAQADITIGFPHFFE
ncbi:UDP-glucose 6-dehydrogenase 1-like [Chenopodium quinoa]|uniref:UDP-glucose 6-dehydrogenase 1-like n=1 Tax=Chenopodium quinoa TaxID=63459 RepID=UPI000B79226D|nr:UDP-glucose 6-dehydrogenase 1-like [Chenopodium quinoa]